MVSNLENTKQHIRETIGNNIEHLRTRASITRSELAARMGMSYQQLYKFERGQNGISAEQIVYLKFYLNASYNEFFKDLF